MPSLNVEVTDFSPQFAKAIQDMGQENFGTVFPNTMAAMNMVAHNYHRQWVKASSGVQLPGMPYAINSRGPYTKSIHVDTSDEQMKVIASTGPYTEWIESGAGEIDLKPGLLAGPKARQGINGPYNIVPFRQGTPGTNPSNNPMPLNVYNLIKKETDKSDAAYRAGQSQKPGTSRVTGQRTTPGMQGKKPTVQRDTQWGYKVPQSAGGMRQTKDTSQGKYKWATGKQTGMARMAADTASAKSSSYITFRVVSINSDPASWIVPPREANPIRQAVIDSLEAETKGILAHAMEADLSTGST